MAPPVFTNIRGSSSGGSSSGGGNSGGNDGNDGDGKSRHEVAAEELEGLFSRLTFKERKFVEAYCGEACGNARKAAELAGYIGEGLYLAQTGYQTSKRRSVQRAIRAMVEMDPLIPTRIERLRLLGEIARGESTYDALDRNGDVVKLQVPPRDRLAALKFLSQLAGDCRTASEKAEDVELPADLTVDELFDLAGVSRSHPAEMRH